MANCTLNARGVKTRVLWLPKSVPPTHGEKQSVLDAENMSRLDWKHAGLPFIEAASQGGVAKNKKKDAFNARGL